MEVDKVVKIFREYPERMGYGSGKLAKWFNCSRDDVKKARKIIRNKEVPKNFPKILIFDIETAPIQGSVWRIWNTNVNLEQIESDWFCLTWSAKWLYSNDTISDKLTKEEVLAENDLRLLKGIWKLIDEADIIIAHNCKKFDAPRLNTRFIINKLQPPSTYKVIDTLYESKKIFDFTSNKLDYINKVLGLSQKLDTGGAKLWIDSLKGDEDALLKMETYNRQDVDILEELYLTIRPWIKSHPNMGVYMQQTNVCSACGSSNIKPTSKYHTTHTSMYKIYKCKDCGAESRRRQSDLDKSVRKDLLVSVPGR